LPGLLAAIQPGGLIFLDDAQIELVILGRTDDAIRWEVRHGGVLLSRKGITAPGVAFGIAALTPKDLDDAAFGLQHGVDWIAISFVRRAADMQLIRDLIACAGAATQIIAKIEKPEAEAALEEILEAADGAMVARGDLGVEVPLYTVPVVQKEIIRRCNALGKPVITATQMLESMTRSPRPTRAEVMVATLGQQRTQLQQQVEEAEAARATAEVAAVTDDRAAAGRYPRDERANLAAQ
jgi:pyruvate kinase